MMRKKCLIIVVTVIVCITLLSALLSLSALSSPPKELGTVRVNIETYLAGMNQPTHPSVVVFPENWHGAKYWLAYSPYPYADGEEENPCLAMSDDMLYWETPKGLANPIADNEDTGCNELKDPHILYRDDLDRLEIWYLGRLSEELGGNGTSLLLMRKCSYDGIHWSEYEVMTSTHYLSPTIAWNDGMYQMWSIGYDTWGTTGTVVYQESQDGIAWSEPMSCVLGSEYKKLDIWHGSVSEHNGEYHFVFIDESQKQEIFYCSSSDGIHFSEPTVIIENNRFWNFLYRPTLAFDGENIFCLYGVVNGANQWYISMSTGTSIDKLTGISESHTAQMNSLADVPIDAHSPRYILKGLYDAMQRYLRLELLVLAMVEVLLLVLNRKLRKKQLSWIMHPFECNTFGSVPLYSDVPIFRDIVAWGWNFGMFS